MPTAPLSSLQDSSSIGDIEEIVARADPVRRATMLRNLTTLYTDYAPRLGQAQVSAFDVVLTHLARNAEGSARMALSRRISAIANAPPGLIRDLAFDDAIAVAGPPLEHALVLGDEDLAAIARDRGQQHLMAITRRRTLAATIADVVVARGDSAVILSVARNSGASFSLDGYTRLIGRGIGDPDLSASLQGRADFPPILRVRAATGAPEAVPSSLAPLTAIEVAARPDDALFAAEVFVGGQARRGELDEATLIGWLNSGRETEALVGLARVAGVPSAMAIEAYHAESYEPLLFLVRSVRFGWRILKLFLLTKTGREAPPEVMQGMMEAFQALTVATAQRVVRVTAARSLIAPDGMTAGKAP